MKQMERKENIMPSKRENEKVLKKLWKNPPKIVKNFLPRENNKEAEKIKWMNFIYFIKKLKCFLLKF
jgi:hypothetical protein